MGMQTPIDFTALPSPVIPGTEIPAAATISVGSDISGANYHPRVDDGAPTTSPIDGVAVAAAASCGGGPAATVTGCVGSNENAHWWDIGCWVSCHLP